ncbi:uncharacterized protein LOC107980708 isoform X2 [Nasonia vitripennis]|uniref:Uncharacterized protein n=1 Tax=Nasonia vitripennis TaxID=7425 RepID=A0A7M7PYU2_NASVI|nr:uncharacterized protein LOC107980708 isoform X2 [Nasonia vitripennis]
MFFRYFLALCVVALFSVVIHASAEEDVVDSTQVEDRANPAAKVVAKIIGSLFTGAAASCLGEAASNCKSHWKNPGKAISCAKNFLKANKGRCAVGK